MVVALAVTAFVPAVAVWMRITQAWPFLIIPIVLMAAFSLPAFQQALVVPLYGARFLKEGIRQGWLPEEQQYYAELARYLETFGPLGHPLGDIVWGLGYWALYAGKLGAAIIFTLVALPVLGELVTLVAYVSLDASVSMTCFILYGRRGRRQYLEAQGKGFRMMQLLPRSRGGQGVEPPG